MNRKTGLLLVAALASMGLLWLAVINFEKPSGQSQKLQVTTSFYPLYFFAQQIAGSSAEVMNITPAGGEPHDYEPTAQDIVQIEKSKLLVLNGGGLEAWGTRILQNLDPDKTLVIRVGEGLTTQQVVKDGENIIDPHVWLSPPLAEKMVDAVTRGFSQADPRNAAQYETNADSLKKKLNDLDKAYQQGLSNCANKNIITSHAAFGYLATTYHLNQVAIAGLSPDAEPSPQQLADIAKFAKENDVKYIFFESLVSPKLAQTIATEVGARTLVLNPMEGQTKEELAAGKNYLTEMQMNLKSLEIALQCKT
ncbi:zinc ABC transporter substrate-binding protein [Candidatus Acetothermia bacterium]|nr:zinc ABC transporter substrate-binding protein [Candidatus Acetothermia bacterium]MBI3643642.1 zinc ABC transporter substrate-binding protein [Candidatus Acetothermia bacterium]